MSVCIELLPIENVSQVDMYRKMGKNHIDIKFDILQTNHYLTLIEINGVFQPTYVGHQCCIIGYECQFCNKPYPGRCKGLEPYRDILFHRLIQHPSIRLEWLYITYLAEEAT